MTQQTSHAMPSTLSRNFALFGVSAIAYLAFPALLFASKAAQDDQYLPQDPVTAAASADAELAMKTFQFPENLSVSLFAAEPLTANPVALHVDNNGNVFVCETYRQNHGVEDNRSHSDWLNEDLAAQTVADRISYILKYEKNAEQKYRQHDDLIRMLVDEDHDGRADRSTVFSNRYNQIEDGTGAGVLKVGDDVFYTNIPHLWRLRDTDGDGVADQRKKLLSGFGVRFAFRGHDLHGLIVGPDGRLYFSIGDRGYNVSATVNDPTSGAVFSCEMDGGDLKVFATGLRNPQELAFDDYGNLFTGDNNSDSGDRARWVYVVPGGDSGWRMYYQYLPDRGPFNREKIWHPYHDETPAYIVPPIDNMADGPSGLAYYPGTGFSPNFENRFFLCDFRGSSTFSGIRSFRLKPQGAGFEIVDLEQTFWNTLATDVEFGPDGKLYVADWVEGWDGPGKGRIYTYADPKHGESPKVRQVQSVLQTGVKNYADDALLELLAHDDRRLRMAAQFELVDRKAAQLLFNSIDLDADSRNAKMRTCHAIWGFTQLARIGVDRDALGKETSGDLRGNLINRLAKDGPNPELMAQLVKGVGQWEGDGTLSRATKIADCLASSRPRIAFMAAMALEKIGGSQQLADVEQMLATHRDQDAFLRHAGIMALTGITSRVSTERCADLVQRWRSHESASVRLAAVVGLRRLEKSGLAQFLNDSDPRVVLESARAIHDLPMGTPELNLLADKIRHPLDDDALLRRVLNANLIVGTAKCANALANFVIGDQNADARKLDALDMLQQWESPLPRDYVLGDWRPRHGKRSNADAQAALAGIADKALARPATAAKFIDVCLKLEVALPANKMYGLATHAESSAALRTSALNMLKNAAPASYEDVLTQLSRTLHELPPALLTLVLTRAIEMAPETARTSIAELLNHTDAAIGLKQTAIRLLQRFEGGESHALLTQLIEQWEAQELEPALFLEIATAIKETSPPALNERLNALEKQAARENRNLTPYLWTLYGGDANNGRKIFVERTALSCLRCHNVDGQGGEVGPVLSDIGLKKNREYLLESIVDPNHKIAEGYNQLIVLTDEGDVVTGIKKDESDELLTLMDKDGKLIRIEVEAIDDRKTGLSSMPSDLIKQIKLEELRDLVEFLAQLKTTPKSQNIPEGH